MFGSVDLDEGSDLENPCDSEASDQVALDMDDEIDISLGHDRETADNSQRVKVLEVSSYYLCCVNFY